MAILAIMMTNKHSDDPGEGFLFFPLSFLTSFQRPPHVNCWLAGWAVASSSVLRSTIKLLLVELHMQERGRDHSASSVATHVYRPATDAHQSPIT